MIHARHAHPIRVSIPPEGCRSFEPSKHGPILGSKSNRADELDRFLQSDGFKTWGFVIYRCTYENDSDWYKFMTLLRNKTINNLKAYNGLDLLNEFAPTVLENRQFEGASATSLSLHFREWAANAMYEEQVITPSEGVYVQSARYRFFVMVDQEALKSVLSAPDDIDTAFVRLVHANRTSGASEEADWINVPYHEVEFTGFVHMCNEENWDLLYARSSQMQFLTGASS